jgi:para-aminobenzoate synthetase component 1
VNAQVQSRFSQKEYIATIQLLQQHILRGDCYEINFCQEFYDNNIAIDPLSTFWSLSKTSPNPFSAFYRLEDKFLLCASPERYIKKVGESIYSQPIKGTWQRDLENQEKDIENKKQLQDSAKERSENVMVVDLVRNDLSRVCVEGSVEVEELFGVYSFPQVHQLVSTIKGILKKGTEPVDVIRASFPMGSMTGAPKRRVLELIEEYERTKRGLFSGALDISLLAETLTLMLL